MRLLVDTNILVHVSNPADPRHLLALDALRQIVRRGFRPCIVPQVVFEFWAVATRPLDVNGMGLTPDSAAECIAGLCLRFHLLKDERGIFEHWRRLVVDKAVLGKGAHDARLVAAMIRHNVTQLLTFNARDFRRYREIEALDAEMIA